MKVVNTAKPLVDLDDIPISVTPDPDDHTPFTVGKAVALILQNYKGRRFDPIKCLELARSFYKKNEVVLNESDKTGIKEIITMDQQFGPIIRGQILEVLEEAPEEGQNP